MSSIQSSPKIDQLRTLLTEAEGLSRQKLDNKGVLGNLERTATKIAKGLEQVRPADLTEDDKKRIAELGAVSVFQKNSAYIDAVARVIANSPGVETASFLRTGAKAGEAVTTNPSTVNTDNAQATLGKDAPKSGPLRRLTRKEEAERANNPDFAKPAAILDDFANGKVEKDIKTSERQLKSLKAAYLKIPKGKEFKEQLDAKEIEIATVEAKIAGLKKQAMPIGLETADAAKDDLFKEIIASAYGAPSALSPAAQALLDKVAKDPAHAEQLIAGLKKNGAPDELISIAEGLKARTPPDAKTVAAMCDAEKPATPPVVNEEMEKLKRNPDAYTAYRSFTREQDEYYAKGKRTFHQIMGLLNSGLPIEAIIAAVMLLLTEREEDKFKLKVKEVGFFEQMESLNEPTRRQIAAIPDKEKLREDLTERLKSIKGSGPEDTKLRETLEGKLSEVAALPEKNAEITRLEGQLISPAKLGLQSKSTTMQMQDLQVAQQMYMQVMQALSAVIRQLQDLVMTPIRNIRA
jgi:hypothetical protein